MTPLPTTPNIPTDTPSQLEISHDILDMLKTAGLTGDDLTRTAKAWLCTEAEINMWAAKNHTPTTTRDHAAREICKLATQMETAIRQHGHIRTPAFTTMPAEKLLQAIDWYEQQLDEHWPAYDAAWSANVEEHAAALAKWERLNTLLWEAKQAAGVQDLTHQVLTGTSLAERLQTTLSVTA